MLKIEDIAKTFNPGTITEKKALKGVTLHLEPGDFVTVIGGNGAGKSTLMNSIAGTFPVDRGKIIIDGQDITKWPEHKRAKYIGRVFQDPMMGTAANMQIEENMAIASRRGKTPTLRWSAPVAQREFFREQLKTLNLGLDEHTAALDPKTAAQVLSLTTDIVHKRNLTTLMITHNMKDALACGNRLIMLHDGKILIDVKGEEKKHLTIKDLLAMFEKAAGSELNSDALLLS